MEDTIADITAAEKNVAEDRLSRESDAQAHQERVRVSALFSVPLSFPADLASRLLRRGTRVRSLRMRRPSKSTRSSSGVSKTFKYPNATIGSRQRLHKPNLQLLRVVGVSKGKHSTERLPISPPGMVILACSFWSMVSDGHLWRIS